MRKIKAKRIVVKVGTNAIAGNGGKLDLGAMRNLVNQIAEIKKNGKEVIIVTSGAIGAGIGELNLKSKPADVVMRQACAAIGQSILMTNYQSLFREHGIKVAQILLTYEDISIRKTYNNLNNSLNKLFELGAIPIINENDPISIHEIKASFGDNDNLSAYIAAITKSDLLIMLTNVDGLYNNSAIGKNPVLIKEVRGISRKIESLASGKSELGVGGMKTKIKAAKTATKAGTTVVIANGKKKGILTKVLNNEEAGTIFYPKNR